MTKIRWIITDIIEDVSKEEFETEWNGIYGYFEIRVNKEVLCFCPDRELEEGEEANENIQYWLYKLVDGMVQLAEGHEYEIPIFTHNLIKLVFRKDINLIIRVVDVDTYEVLWTEEVEFQEFCNEVKLNAERFIAEVKRLNADLLECYFLKELTDPLFDERFVSLCDV